MKDSFLPSLPTLLASSRMPTILGIDIAKSSFCLHHLGAHTPKKSTTLPNSWDGFRKLLDCVPGPDQEVLLGVEATSIYHMELAQWAHDQGWTVFVINARYLKKHIESFSQTHKTDAIDAWHIAEFVSQKHHLLRAWSPTHPAWAQAKALSRLRLSLVKTRVSLENRLESTLQAHIPVRQSLERMIESVQGEIEELEVQLEEMMLGVAELKEQVKRLQQIPGIGQKTAMTLSVELGELKGYASGKELTACTGLVPVERTSGSSVKDKSKVKRVGNKRARSALYLAAMSARRSKAWQPWIEKREKTKTGMNLIFAIMDKMLRLAFGVMRHDQDFDPEIAFYH